MIRFLTHWPPSRLMPEAKDEGIPFRKTGRNLIKPSKLESTPAMTRALATVVAEPLERGFGLTLGQRAAPRPAVFAAGRCRDRGQIDGVLHEFSSIPGVREDVTDIVLNIKEIAIRMEGEGPKRMVVRKQGPGVGHRRRHPDRRRHRILNPDAVLCTLDEGAEIRMEFTVNTGKGYVRADRNRPEDAPIGLIPVDSLYSPVKKVSYKVENTREGQVLDYDKLT
jgi:DNA-directed RNA polymerase subunit alpha